MTPKVQWNGGRLWWLRWLTSAEYRRQRRLAMSVARELVRDPDHQRKVETIVRRISDESRQVTICHHPDHLDALFTATACPGCQREP